MTLKSKVSTFCTLLLVFFLAINIVPIHLALAASTVHFLCSTMNRGNGGSITFAGGTYQNGQSTSANEADYVITANPPANYFFYRWTVLWLRQQSWVDNLYSQTTTFHLREEAYLKAEFYAPISANYPTSPITWGTKERVTGSAGQYSGQSLSVVYCSQGSGMGPPNRNGVPPFGSGNNGYLWATVIVNSGTWDTTPIYPTLPISLGQQLPQTYDVYALYGSDPTSEVDSNVVTFTLNPATPQMDAPTLTPGSIQLGQQVTITDEIFSSAFVNGNDLSGTLTVQAKKQGTSTWIDVTTQQFTSNYGYSNKYGQYGDYYDLSIAWIPSEAASYDVRAKSSGTHYYVPITSSTSPLIVSASTVTIASGNGGSVSYSSPYGSGTVPSGQNTSIQAPSGAQVSLTANPDSQHVFHVWTTTGAVSVGDPTSTSTALTVNGNGVVTANFASTLAVSISPGSATIQIGQSVPFTATASGGSGTYSDYTWYWTENNTVNHGSYDSGSLNTYTFTPSEVGNYTVYVVVTDNSSNTAQSLSSSVIAQSPPPPQTCNLQILVHNQQHGNPIQGATVTIVSAPNEQNLLNGTTDSSGQYTFQNILIGSYSVQATAPGYSPGTGSATVQVGQTGEIQIILSSTLSASAVASPSSGTIPLSVQFTGSASGGISPYSYSWTFGDGSSSNQQNPSYTYQSAGSYIATLAVLDSEGNTVTSSVGITILVHVHFSESGLPSTLSAVWNVTLNGQTLSSDSPGNSLFMITFTGPKGGPYSYAVTPPSGYTVYPSAGSIMINYQDRTIGVSFNALAPLSASAVASPSSGTIPLSVQFTGSASGGISPYSYSWTFGDGSSSNQQNPSYTYYTMGTYTTTLTVTDSNGKTAQSIAIISSTGTYSVSFTESGLPVGTNWSVTFNGGTQSSTTNTITFSQPNGQYSYSVGSVQGYPGSPSQGFITVSGSNVVQHIAFASTPTYTITFAESGLASGTTWSVTMVGVGTQNTTAPSSIVFTVSSESYSYSLEPVAGYSGSPSSGTITVSGNSVNRSITYTISSASVLVVSEYSGYFLEHLPFTNKFAVFAGSSGGASPVGVYGILDGVNHTFSNPSGPGGYYSLSVDMGQLTLVSSLDVYAVYSDGTKVHSNYPISVIETPSWLMSILNVVRNRNIQKGTGGEWNNTYVVDLDMSIELQSKFNVSVPLPKFAGGGDYVLLPSVGIEFSFNSSGTFEMTSLLDLETKSIPLGPVSVAGHITISVSGEFDVQNNSIQWISATFSLGVGISASVDVPIAGYTFNVPVLGKQTIGLTATVKVDANFAINMILAPTQNASEELVSGVEVMIQSITGQISLSMGLALNAGIGVVSVTGGGEVDFTFYLQATQPYIYGCDVTGSVSIELKALVWSGTIWSMSGTLYHDVSRSIKGSDLSSQSIIGSDPDMNFTLTPRYYNTPDYENITWANGSWNGTAVEDIYPFTSISAASYGNNTCLLCTSDNVYLPEKNGLSLMGLNLDSSQGTLTPLEMPAIVNEILFNPTVVTLPNGTFLGLWNSIPLEDMNNATSPFDINRILLQYSCYDAQSGAWGQVENLTQNGVALSNSLFSDSTGCYALVLEGDGVFSLNQYLMEYNLQDGSDLSNVGVANVSNIVSFNAFSQIAVLHLVDGSYQVLNLTSHLPITIPSMNDYEITNVQLATNSTYSLGILYGNLTSNIFCIYNISSSNVSFSMSIPQTPNDITFAQEGSEYRLITADPSGITSYCIDGPSAGTPLFYPMQNITSMGSTITDNGVLVYTTVNYGNSTDPLLDMTLTLIPDVTVLNGTIDKTIAGLGYSANINVTVGNQGMHPEYSYVTLYANNTAVGQAEVSAANGNSTIIPLTWNTTDLTYGDYILSVSAGPVLGEIGGTSNYICDILVHVGVPGDVSSTNPGVYDKVVNMKDIAYMVSVYNTKPDSSNWNPNADVNNDGVVNMKDIAIAVYYFNQHE